MNRLASLGKSITGVWVVSGMALLLAGCPQNGGIPVCGNGTVESGEDCDDGNTTSGDGCSATCQVESGTVVDVSLREFTVTPSPATAPAGLVTFRVKNNGTVMHEFLVIKTDLAPDALPTEENGSYQEDGPGTDLLDEISDTNPGQTKTLALTLEAGKYVLICNMVNQGVSHYAQGMHAAFTVTAAQ